MLDTLKVVLPAILAFSIGIGITPVITHYLYKYRVWKKRPGKTALDGSEAVEFNKIDRGREGHVPRMGGIVIWASVFLATGVLFMCSRLFPGSIFGKLDFLSRDQTWIPLSTLLVGGVVGFINDLLDVREEARGIPLNIRLFVVTALSGAIGWWFYAKLGVSAIGIPFFGSVPTDGLIVPLFILVSLVLYASGVIDGIDGLSGGVFASVFSAFAIIAFSQNQINLAAFCAAMTGGLLAFLWFNIPPARFWMTETGTMGITLTIATVAFLANLKGEGRGIAALPIVGALLFATVASNILQVTWKRLFRRKLFKIAPLHHHFESIGWPGYKVTMRYWVLSIIFAFSGVLVALSG